MQIRIDSLSHDGKGITRVDGKVAFVPGALPGETVEAALVRRHRRYDELRLVRLVEAAPERVTPPCPLVGRCGGCDLQHVDSNAQRLHKQETVLELLERQAGLVPECLEEPLLSPAFGYRRRARLAMTVPRRGKPVLGFREAAGSRVVPVAECSVLAAEISALPGALQQALGELRSARRLGHLELTVAEAAGGTTYPLIHVRATARLPDHDVGVLRALAESHHAGISLRVGDEPLTYLHRPVAGPPVYHLPEFDLRMAFEPGDFLQGNAAVNRQLVSRAAAWLGNGQGRRMLDAFAGLGNFSLPLARRGWNVLGLEGDVRMVHRARENARTNDVGNIDFRVRDLMEQPPDSAAFEAALLDPPRAGARLLTESLARAGVPRVLYVSCAPATLARDAALLASAGYRLSRLCLVDMFPQTSHVEVLAEFSSAPDSQSP